MGRQQVNDLPNRGKQNAQTNANVGKEIPGQSAKASKQSLSKNQLAKLATERRLVEAIEAAGGTVPAHLKSFIKPTRYQTPEEEALETSINNKKPLVLERIKELRKKRQDIDQELKGLQDDYDGYIAQLKLIPKDKAPPKGTMDTT